MCADGHSKWKLLRVHISINRVRERECVVSLSMTQIEWNFPQNSSNLSSSLLPLVPLLLNILRAFSLYTRSVVVIIMIHGHSTELFFFSLILVWADGNIKKKKQHTYRKRSGEKSASENADWNYTNFELNWIINSRRVVHENECVWNGLKSGDDNEIENFFFALVMFAPRAGRFVVWMRVSALQISHKLSLL